MKYIEFNLQFQEESFIFVKTLHLYLYLLLEISFGIPPNVKVYEVNVLCREILNCLLSIILL